MQGMMWRGKREERRSHPFPPPIIPCPSSETQHSIYFPYGTCVEERGFIQSLLNTGHPCYGQY